MTPPLVAGFGSVVADVLMLADAVSLDHKNHVAHQAIQVGGVVPTALIVLSRLGIATQLYTTVGDDLFGDALQTLFKKENVGLGKIVRGEKTETPLAFVIIHKKTGHRTSFYTTGAFPNISPVVFRDALDTRTTHLLIDGHNSTVALNFIRKARQQGTQVLLDLGNPKHGMEQLVEQSHVIIAPQAYWSIVWPNQQPETIIRHLLTTGPELVVLTKEEKGCFVGQKETVFHQPSFTVQAVDTNGAGDVFFGAFTYGILQNWPMQKTAEFACAAAAQSCTKIGKDQKIPRSETEVHDFMKAHAPTT